MKNARNLTKRLGILAGALLSIKSLFIPVLAHVASTEEIWENGRFLVPTITEIDAYNPNFQGDDESVALSYLKLAHAVTTKHMTYELNPDISEEEMIKQGRGDCSEFSRFTYDNFLHLINTKGRPELADYVRHARGIAKMDNGENNRHAWLEIKQGNEWKHYETTNNDLWSGTEIKPDSIDYLVDDSKVINPLGGRASRHNTTRFNSEGELEKNIYLANAISDGLGIDTNGDGSLYSLNEFRLGGPH